MHMTNEPFAFRPPVRRQGLRTGLGVFLSLLAVGAGLFGVAVVWLPRALEYQVTQGTLTVTTGITLRPTITEVTLEDIEKANPVDLQRGSRIGGTSLPGYCAGAFRFPELGRVRLATDCGRRAVALRVREWQYPWVLSPGDRDAFLGSLAGEGIYSESFETGGGGAGWIALKTMVLIVLVPTLLIPFVFFLSPRRLKYRVNPGHLEVDTTLGTKRFTVDNCIARVYDPETSSKVFGSSMPGFYSGRFSVDGMSTRVYATHFDAGVLIEGPDLRLFVTPDEPHAFLECLRARGGMPVE